jgi:hypothetical protein
MKKIDGNDDTVGQVFDLPKFIERLSCLKCYVQLFCTHILDFLSVWQKKIGAKAAHKIDYCCQFHQHFTSNFCANILSTKIGKAKLYVNKSWL